MAVLPASLSASGSLEVYVAVENTLMIVDASESNATNVFEGPIVKLAISPDGKMVAGFAADSTVHIWSADMEDIVTRVGVWETSEDAEDILGISTAPDG